MVGLGLAINGLAAHTDADTRDKPAHDGDNCAIQRNALRAVRGVMMFLPPLIASIRATKSSTTLTIS
jgi:hypothetical protein